jgi:hypothetical protein
VRNRLLLLLAGALAVIALALPAASSADGCPKGQTGTPPYCSPLPSNKFNLGKVKHPSTGVVTIRVKVSSGGTFTATADLMKTAKATGKSAGSFTLKLELNAKGMAELEKAKGRQLRIKVKFTFSPTGGEPRTKLKKLIFRVVKP